jgi:hypothetical protein
MPAGRTDAEHLPEQRLEKVIDASPGTPPKALGPKRRNTEGEHAFGDPAGLNKRHCNGLVQL